MDLFIQPPVFPLDLNSPWKSVSTHGWVHANTARPHIFNRFLRFGCRQNSQIRIYFAFSAELFANRSPEILLFHFWVLARQWGEESFKMLNLSYPLAVHECGVPDSTAPRIFSLSPIWIHKLLHCATQSTFRSESRGKFKLQNHQTNSISLSMYRDDQWMDTKNACISRRQAERKR